MLLFLLPLEFFLISPDCLICPDPLLDTALRLRFLRDFFANVWRTILAPPAPARMKPTTMSAKKSSHMDRNTTNVTTAREP